MKITKLIFVLYAAVALCQQPPVKKLTVEQKLAIREAQLAATSAALQATQAQLQAQRILAEVEQQAACKVDAQMAECKTETPPTK